jgi:Zn-dependent oligopeptidase
MHAHIGFQGCADSLQDLGHCIHFLLAQGSRYYRFNGFSIELDLIEVPSLLLEELLADFEVVSQMAINLMGEEIPREYHEVLARSRDMDRAMTVRTQTLYSLISVRLGMKAHITTMLTFPRSKTAGSPLEPR